MQLTEVGLEAETLITRTLTAAFPDRDTKFWHAGFNRMREYVGDQPVACLLGNPDKPDGIMLMLPNKTTGTAPAIASTQLNLSSWWVSDAQRGQAIWMFRKIVNRKDVIFTDLTPTDTVTRMMPAMGFKPVSAGLARIVVPRVAIKRDSAWKIIGSRPTIERTSDPLVSGALTDHVKLGCIVAGLVWQNRCFPVVLKKRMRRGLVPAAEVIYFPVADPDMPDLRAAIPSLAAHLLSRGILLLEMEISAGGWPPIRAKHRQVNPGARYARGPYMHGGINHLYSEFAYFDF